MACQSGSGAAIAGEDEDRGGEKARGDEAAVHGRPPGRLGRLLHRKAELIVHSGFRLFHLLVERLSQGTGARCQGSTPKEKTDSYEDLRAVRGSPRIARRAGR